MQIRDCMKQTVFSIPTHLTVKEAAAEFISRRVGLLPVVDTMQRPVGVVSLSDLLKLELPDFVSLIGDVDFVHDFGAAETTLHAAALLTRPITQIMRPATTVVESCGLLRAYALMLQRDLHDLPVVNAEGVLVGIASRVDLGVAILSRWTKEN